MNELKGLYFGSYWMGDNDVVRLMALDFQDLCDLVVIDTHLYDDKCEGWFENDYSQSKQWPVRWLNEDKVLEAVKKVSPDFTIINSGGMSFRPSTIKALKGMDITTVDITLSDPDVYMDNGRIYSQYYDICYTNSLYALRYLYGHGVNVKLMPFAASPRLHRPIDVEKIYDVVIVGHARPDRIKTVKQLQEHFKVGLFGDGWGDDYQTVHGEEHVKAINSGKMYLSFSGTLAGFNNVKVGLFEAMACRTCVITEYFDEMERYFKYGTEILGFVDDRMLVDQVATYLKIDQLRTWIADNSYERLLREHTWANRWKDVLDDIIEYRNGKKAVR